MAERGLTDGDRAWLEERFKAFQEDSTRQWKFITKLDTDLQLHVQASNAKHGSPCETAKAEIKAHVEESHNPTKKIRTFGIWAGTTAAVAEALHWLHKFFEKP